MTRKEFLEKIKICTKTAIIDVDGLRVNLIAPQRDLWKIHCVVEPIRPIGMLVTCTPMSLWQQITTRGVKFRERGY